MYFPEHRQYITWKVLPGQQQMKQISGQIKESEVVADTLNFSAFHF